ncbi:35225_t:CDS:2, partial [Racocetra persica]
LDQFLYDALKNNLVKYINPSTLLWSDPESIASSCKKFVDDFNKPEDIQVLRNVVHNKSWKKNESDFKKRTE